MLAVAPMIELLLPEIVLMGGATLILLTGVSKTLSRSATLLATVFIFGALAATYRHSDASMLEASRNAVEALNPGYFANYVRMIVLAVGLLIVFANRHVPEDGERAEFVALTMFSLAGVMLAGIANNLIMLFLALELVSVPTYILIGLSRRDLRAQEATAKYFFLGAFAAALTLYGFSFLYGATGQLTLFGEHDSISAWVFAGGSESRMNDGMFLLGMLLSLGGLAFKLAAAPFHFYVADVYQGAAAAVTGMLGFVPKFAGLVAAIHIVGLVHWNLSTPVFWGLWVMAAVTMTVGNTLAFMQYNIKRMLAYSSVAHSGYMLMALLVGPGSESDPTAMRNGIAALLFYMAVYGIANLGVFCALAWFRKPGRDDAYQSAEMLEDIAGTGRTDRWAALSLSLCVLALMGFPLTGGFLGKLYIFGSVFASMGDQPERSAALIALVVIGALNAAVGAAYYLRIIASCYWDEPRENRLAPTPCSALLAVWVVCGLLVPVLFFFPGTLARNAVSAARANQIAANARTFKKVAQIETPVSESLMSLDAPASEANSDAGETKINR